MGAATEKGASQFPQESDWHEAIRHLACLEETSENSPGFQAWERAECGETSLFKLRDLFQQEGVSNQIYLSRSAFLLVHHDAIDMIYELGIRNSARA